MLTRDVEAESCVVRDEMRKRKRIIDSLVFSFSRISILKLDNNLAVTSRFISFTLCWIANFASLSGCKLGAC